MRRSALSKLFVTTATAAFGLGLASAACAQDAAPAASNTEVEEVVVTAQKREQKLQDVPAAVSAFGSAQLEGASVQSLIDLNGKAPNVVLAPVGAYPYASAFYIRGLGFADVESSFEPSVGVEMNGVYLARNSGALQDFFDIDSVEVLRGPQGTLYGRNTIGGVVSVRTKRPTGQFGGEVQATYGNYGKVEGRAAVEFPMGDMVSARVSVLYKDFDGYNYNATTKKNVGDNEVLTGRATVVFKPNDTFDATLILDKDRERGSGAAFRNASLPGQVYYNFGVEDPNPYVVKDNTPVFANLDTWGASLEANYDLGPATLTSITGYREFDDTVQSDYDGTAVNFFAALRDQSHKQFSSELRIASNGENRLNYVAGIYFLDQSYDISNAQSGLIYKGATLTQFASQSNTAWALFGQADYKITDQLSVTAGGRFSYEEKTFTNQPLGFTVSRTYSNTWNDFSPKLGVNYAFTPRIMGYASWSKGFRSGGYNGRAATFTSAGPYKAETVSAYEVGLKTELFDRRVRFNVAAFSSEYSDMQTGVQGLTSAGIYESLVVNAAKAKIEGAEAEVNWIAGAGFTIDASVGYLDARYENYIADLTSDGVTNPTDNTALPLPYAPKWSASLGVNYAHQFEFGRLTANVNATYQDDIYTSNSTLNLTSNVMVREANTIANATIGFEGPGAKWRVALWGKNLTDETVINNTFGLGALGNLRIYSAPRTYGVDLSYRF